MWTPMQPLCILHWNTQSVISSLSIISPDDTRHWDRLGIRSVADLHGSAAVAMCVMITALSRRWGRFILVRTYPGYFHPSQPLHLVFQPDVASGFPAPSELRHRRPSSTCIPLSPSMWCGPPSYFDSVFFSTFGLKQIFWKSNDPEKV